MMDLSTEGEAIEEHGTTLDEEKKRVRCNYCEKEVQGFNRLKHHLSGVGNDVTPCTKVPADVKGFIKDTLIGKKKERLLKEVGRIEHPELPWKRSLSSPPSEMKRCKLKSTHPSAPKILTSNGAKHVIRVSHLIQSENGNDTLEPELKKGKYTLDTELLNEGHQSQMCFKPPHLAALNKISRTVLEKNSNENYHIRPCQKSVLGPCSVENISGRIHASCTDQDKLKIAKEEVMDGTMSLAARYIGRFFFEAGIDPALTKLPSFQEMIDSVVASRSGYKVPNCEDLNGWILQDEVKEVTACVEVIKRSWAQTGCSILLDNWNDQRGRCLINFLVDCPHGTVFLKSADVTDVIEDANAFFLLVDMIIKEVGVENVVQVISDNGSDTMEDVGQKVMNKYRSIFWTLCADHCINWILEKIQMIPHVHRILDHAKTLTRFIYSDPLTKYLVAKQMSGKHIVRTSTLKSVASFVTLHNMISEKENIVNVFTSLTSPSSSWASKTKSKAMAKLVKDVTFWSAATDILKITDPLIGILNEICRKDRHAMGVLYESMDQAKEIIKTNVGGEQEKYEYVWDLVDEIWSGHLHSPLHVLGYYLNPSFFYYNLHCDAEVANGLSYSMSRMAENQPQHDLLTIQLDVYREARGGFGGETAVDQRTRISPDLWWSEYAGHCPELQRVAIKVLSQRCSVSPKYKLTRAVTEKLHEELRNCIEQKRLHDMEFIHNNRCLWRLSPTSEPEDMHCHDGINPFDEWIVDGSSLLV